MLKACYGFANSSKNVLVVMDIMLKNGIKIVSVTDAGPTTWTSDERFNIFGVAEDQSQIKETGNDIAIKAKELEESSVIDFQ